MKKSNDIVYRETQQPRQTWLGLPILLCAGYMWYWFIQQIIYGIPVGDNPR